jgi:ABC-2 type transport system ATP-binding protein
VPTLEPAIDAQGVRKRYPGGRESAGLGGLDLQVPAGTVFGLLGPNGAGKTTAVRIMATLLSFDAGRVTVAGADVRSQPGLVRRRIGLVGQYAAVDEILSARRNLVLFGRLSHLPRAQARRRAAELLERFDLVDAADESVATFSGGMRRRLDLAAALVTSPQVLLVDEPTTGLDPAARREVWAAIRELAEAGSTVLLTTQYLEEADQLAGRIALLTAGRVVAEGTPGELKARVGDDRIELRLATPADAATAAGLAGPFACGEIRTDEVDRVVRIPVREHARALLEVAGALRDAGVVPADITVRRPSLDEVFFALTGAGTAEATAAAAEGAAA